MGRKNPHEPERLLDDFSPQWCQDLINDPSVQHVSAFTRQLGAGGGATGNSLLGKTLCTESTVRAVQMMYRPARPGHEDAHAGGEMVALYSLGDELCSNAGVLHGGLCAVLADEVAGYLALRQFPSSAVGVNLNVAFKGAVKTPGLVLARAWIERPPERRKIFVRIQIEQDRRICLDGEGLYLRSAEKM